MVEGLLLLEEPLAVVSTFTFTNYHRLAWYLSTIDTAASVFHTGSGHHHEPGLGPVQK